MTEGAMPSLSVVAARTAWIARTVIHPGLLRFTADRASALFHLAMRGIDVVAPLYEAPFGAADGVMSRSQGAWAEAESVRLAARAAMDTMQRLADLHSSTSRDMPLLGAASAMQRRLGRSGSAKPTLSGAQAVAAALAAASEDEDDHCGGASGQRGGGAAAVGEATLGGTAAAWRYADVTRTAVVERLGTGSHSHLKSSALQFPDIIELKWRPSLSHGGAASSLALLATDASGRVMVISSDPAETLWHAPLCANAGPSGHRPAVARAGREVLTGLCDLPYAQYLSGDYDELTRDLHWQ